MAVSAASHTLLNVLNQSDTSKAANTAAQAGSEPNAESELSSVPPSTHTTPRSTRRTKRVQWIDEVNDQATGRPRRSTRGVAPKRLGESPEAESSTQARATLKRKQSTQPPQPPPKKISALRKPLSNAANTLGKTRGSNTTKVVAKPTPARSKPPTKPSAPKSQVQPSPPSKSTTTTRSTFISKNKRYKGLQKNLRKQPIQKTAVKPVVSLPPPAIKFKLHFTTRWELKPVSNDDTHLFDTNTSWIEVMKLMDKPIHDYCRSNGIYNQMPYKIRAIITSSRANRASKETSIITLEHASAKPWGRVVDLARLNYSNGIKDISITIDSVWTPAGLEPPEPEPVPKLEPSSQRGKRTQRSLLQSAEYQETRGLFWNDVKTFWICDQPMHCKVKARNGIACWIHHGRHYEITYSMAAKWREAIDRDGGSIRHPPRTIRKLIKQEDELNEQREARKLADKLKAKAVPSQASPAVSQVFYVGSQAPPPSTQEERTQPPRQKSKSPIPVELDSAEGWVAFWDSIKAAVRDTRPESWQAGLDRAMAALDADFWTLSMLFKATDTALKEVVPQTGLRVLIHEHLSKFISSHREAQAGPSRALNFGGTAPGKNAPDRVDISSDDTDDDMDSTDDNVLNSDVQDEQQDDTSDGML